MAGFEGSDVTSVDGLAALYAAPLERIVKFKLDHVNAAGRAFIAASPFLVIATGSQLGLDCSPKWDQPGFVEVVDDGKTLLIPDRRGNNKIDSLKNLVEDPRIALIFFVPDANETVRVNGRARISADANLKRRFTVNGKEPATVMVVTVDEAFHHCPKALSSVRLLECGQYQPSQRRADNGRLRGGAPPRNGYCCLRCRIQPTHSE